MKQTEEEFFKNLLSKSKLEIPSPDFEENIMSRIQKEKVHHHQPSYDIKLSWVLLLIVVIFGIGLSVMATQLQFSLEIPAESLKIAFELILVIFVLLQIDTLLHYPFKSNEGLKNHLREF